MKYLFTILEILINDNEVCSSIFVLFNGFKGIVDIYATQRYTQMSRLQLGEVHSLLEEWWVGGLEKDGGR
jgi:hypothetical protein